MEDGWAAGALVWLGDLVGFDISARETMGDE